MTVIDRFFKTGFLSTTSDERSQTCPSTPQQLVLAESWSGRCRSSVSATRMDDADGYVYGTIPANCEKRPPCLRPHRPHGYRAGRARAEYPTPASPKPMMAATWF